MQPENYTPPNQSMPPVISPNPVPIPAPPKKRLPFSHRTMIIIGVVVVVLVLFGIIAALKASKKTGNTTGTSSSVYYNRAGYVRSSLSTGTGDPEALKPVANATAVNYGGSPVVQACNVLSLDDLHKANLHLTPNPLTEVMTRNFFDGKGPATLPLDLYSLPSDDATNSCAYGLQDGLGITLNVFQSTYVPASAVQDKISRLYTPRPDVNGSQVYFYQADKTLEYYMIKTGNIYSQLAVTSGDGAPSNPNTVVQTLVNTVAQNIPKEAAHPAGPATMTYDSPLFKKSYANACELTNNSDFRSIYGSDASPIAQEDLGSGIGVINFHDTGAADINYNYIDNDCKRESIVNGVSGSASGISVNQTYLTVQTESFLDNAPATLRFTANQKSGNNVTAVNTKIGDQVMFSDQAGLHSALTFRQGRFLVNLSVVQPGANPTFSTASMIKYLTPVAQRIAGELQKQQNS